MEFSTKGTKAMKQSIPLGCGAELTRKLEEPVIGRVDITYFCTGCGVKETTLVQNIMKERKDRTADAHR